MNTHYPTARHRRGLALAAGGLLAPAPLAAAATPACTNADLTASYHHGDAAPVTATAGSCCATRRATPAAPVATAASRTSATATAPRSALPRCARPARRRDYVLEPGQRLRSSIDEVTALNYPRKPLPPTHVDGFRVYVPERDGVAVRRAPDDAGAATTHVKLILQKPYRRP